jgi:hypothetical protein
MRLQNLESRALRALNKVPHLRSSPIGRGEQNLEAYGPTSNRNRLRVARSCPEAPAPQLASARIVRMTKQAPRPFPLPSSDNRCHRDLPQYAHEPVIDSSRYPRPATPQLEPIRQVARRHSHRLSSPIDLASSAHTLAKLDRRERRESKNVNQNSDHGVFASERCFIQLAAAGVRSSGWFCASRPGNARGPSLSGGDGAFV